ncbi:MAG TPA: sodium/solute symporter [Candidatus Hydrogenedentes bacterium]|nr:sodium/solute symporter [Candidatus Hydrogenedentota bacterium]HQE82067.1 sodium/solute symporter [Candidatus Hydrogenedentota bacterium]HQH54347.1 sodium/solute symporter [Candidatus Hydrogenedentota bacterium]HQM47144.1 sodium/solute symporter [Candidatus Hydrogenedentota bacterium]
MQLSVLDIAVFLGFFAVVIAFSMYKSRKERTSEDYFLASRGLIWPLIGFSIVAANLSTEQFVGMAGQGAGAVGLAVSNWQLSGSVAIVLVAFFFLPRLLRHGLYTMPEYLEYRYNALARALMAVCTVIIYVTVTITAVLYSGGITLKTIFGLELHYAIWLIGGIAALYTVWGGLKAVAWADLFQGGALLAAGFITMVLGFKAIGGVEPFLAGSAGRLHMILPHDHPELPWTSLLAGIWIPNFYYCGLNQFIVQRTLAAKNLRQGQLGVIFAGGLWLLVPFVIVFPGIMALQLYGGQMETADQAYPILIRNLIPMGLRGFIFAAIAGAVISSLASMLNSASTIFTMDLYKRHLNQNASQRSLVFIGRAATLACVVLGCLVAPILADPRFGGVFSFIQKFQGYISPGILAAFVFGFAVHRAPGAAGVAALLGSPVIYGILDFVWGERLAYLNQMALTFGLVIAIMTGITLVAPLKEPKALPVRQEFDTRLSPVVLAAGIAVIAGVALFYAVFW